jgi:Uma2 family endonuclease
MAILSRPFTDEDLLRQRETRDERLELIDGEIVVTPSPTPMHQLIVHRLAVILNQAIVATGAGLVLESPLDVFLETHNVFQPDVIVLLRDRVRLFGPQMVESAPEETTSDVAVSANIPALSVDLKALFAPVPGF